MQSRTGLHRTGDTLTVGGKGSYKGGLIGYKLSININITSCFWDIETSGQTTSAGGKGVSTEDRQKILTFTDEG
jgi:hypothetical protein